VQCLRLFSLIAFLRVFSGAGGASAITECAVVGNVCCCSWSFAVVGVAVVVVGVPVVVVVAYSLNEDKAEVKLWLLLAISNSELVTLLALVLMATAPTIKQPCTLSLRGAMPCADINKFYRVLDRRSW